MRRPVTKEKKGAMFFTVDAMIAAIVVSITAILVISLYIQKPVTEDTFLVLNNYVDYISNTKMDTFKNQYRYIYDGQNETDVDLFVYQKIAKLEIEGNSAIATDFAKNITENVINLVPPQFGFQYYVDNNKIYQRSSGNSADFGEEFTQTNISYRILTYYTNSSDEVVGPIITRITMWS